MIGRITGTLLEKSPPQIIVDANGLGYEVEVPMSTFYNLPATGERVSLHTHLVVREDAHLLFGFGTEPERATFRQLVKISGVGARTALAVLSGLSVAELSQAIARQESGRLIKVPGIGKKGAQRILLELKGKLSRSGSSGTSVSSSQPMWREQLSGALISLGYSAREADSTISIVAIDYANRGLDPAHSDLSELLKAALAGGKS